MKPNFETMTREIITKGGDPDFDLKIEKAIKGKTHKRIK